jgi:glyoxylase-like metal-dependent hydrolase (beta-lactamase superfamily II)
MCFLYSITLLWILYAIKLKRCISFSKNNELWVVSRYDRLQPYRSIRTTSISKLYRSSTFAFLLDSRQEEVGRTKAKHQKISKRKYNNTTTDGGNDDADEMTTLSGKGISVDDWLSSRKVKANTKFTILPKITGARTSSEVGFIQVEQGDLPINRYVIPLPSSGTTEKHNQQQDYNYYMIDIPPFSQHLVQEIRLFLKKQTYPQQEEGEEVDENSDYFSTTNGTNTKTKRRGRNSSSSTSIPPKAHQPTLRAILITCKTSIYYSEAPGTVYSMRKSDLSLWKEAFPGVEIIMHRNDMEKDLQGSITQVLDGYGPWAWNETTGRFDETGHKLVVLNWDRDKIMRLYSSSDEINATELALREAGIDPNQVIDVRANEANRGILAVYTPGHTMGSMCYVMPPLELCFSGHTLPEDQFRDNVRFDGLGTVSTNKAGLLRQVDSALHFADTYVDRFHTILPSRGNVIYLPKDDLEQRRSSLKLAIKQFGKVAKAYSDLGIL